MKKLLMVLVVALVALLVVGALFKDYRTLTVEVVRLESENKGLRLAKTTLLVDLNKTSDQLSLAVLNLQLAEDWIARTCPKSVR